MTKTNKNSKATPASSKKANTEVNTEGAKEPEERIAKKRKNQDDSIVDVEGHDDSKNQFEKYFLTQYATSKKQLTKYPLKEMVTEIFLTY